MRSTRWLIAAIASALMLTGCQAGPGDTGPEPGSTNGSSSPTDVVYVAAATVPGSTNVGVIAVARALGFFEEENIQIGEEYADGSTAAMQVMTAESGDVSAAGVVSIMGAVASGVPIKGFANVIQNYHWRMGVLDDSSITSAADLRGKSIGIISFASESNFFSRAWLKENGINPETEVTLVPVGAGAPALQALRDGQVDALASYTEMFQVMENTGDAEFVFLENPAMFQDMPSISLTATDSMLKKDPDVLVRFGRAAFKGLLFAWLNPEAAVRISYEAYPEKKPQANFDAKLAEDTKVFKAWIAAVMPLTGGPESWTELGSLGSKAWDNALHFGTSAGQVKTEVKYDAVWDNSLIEQINDFDRSEVIELAKTWTPADL